MAFNEVVAKSLATLLEKECSLYEKYKKLVEEQREYVTNFNSEKMLELDEKRLTLQQQMMIMHEQRLELISKLPDTSNKKLLEVIQEQASPKQIKSLAPVAQKLKKLVEITRHETLEFQMVQNFALSVVNGSLSLIGRATRQVSKLYGKDGEVNEAYVPKKSRKEGVIKEA